MTISKNLWENEQSQHNTTQGKGSTLIVKASCINRKTLSHIRHTKSSIKIRFIDSFMYLKSEGYHFMFESVSHLN